MSRTQHTRKEKPSRLIHKRDPISKLCMGQPEVMASMGVTLTNRQLVKAIRIGAEVAEANSECLWSIPRIRASRE